MRIKVLNCSNYSFYSHATLQHFDILSLHDALPISGAGLLVRTLENLKSINPGFDTHNILLFTMDPSLNGYTSAQTRSLYSQMLQRIEAIPGVVSATYSFDSLLSGNYWDTSFRIEGETQNTQHETYRLAAGPKFS